MALTERQQEIVDLQKQGKSAPDIAKALGISTNAVYQQLRKAKQSGGSMTTGRKSAAKKPAAKPAAQPAAAPEPKVQRIATPLQAIRAQRDEVNAGLKDAERTYAEAEKALEAAKTTLVRLQEKVAPTLAQLDAAEAAIKGELSLPKAKAPAKAPAKKPAAKKPAATNGTKADAAATPTPATQAEREATADLIDAADAQITPVKGDTVEPVTA